MRIFVARSGRLTTLTAALLGLTLTSAWAEGETPGDAGGAAGAAAGAQADSNNNLGVGIFSRFPFNISVSVRGGYDDNVSTSTVSEEGSGFVTAGLVVAYDLGTPRTTLKLSTSFGFTYYSALDTDPFEPNLNLALSVSHKVTPRLTLNFTGLAAYQTEPDFQYGFGTNRRAGNFFFTQDTIGATYVWTPRFATATTYSLVAVQYDDMATGTFEDRLENTFANEFRFLIWPTTNLVAEYRFQVVTYQHIDRDSTTNYFLGGFDHAFSPRLTAGFRGGAQLRNYTDFEDSSSPYFQGNVNYKLGKDTAIGWDFHYGIEEGDVALNPTRTSFRTGVQGKHDFSARITGSLALFFYHDNYEAFETPTPMGPPIMSPSFSENSFSIDLAVRYAATRYLGIEAGYSHNEVSGDSVGGFRDYSRNRVWAGVSFSF